MTAVQLLAREADLQEGDAPSALDSPLATGPLYSIAADAFLMKLPSGLRFHYRRGRGVTFSRPAGITDAEVALFHSGSVYGAVAWINGLFPLHASAVVHEGKVHAFTGESGAGKSTLGAALSQRGLPLFADDVLVLDLSDPAQPMALPGHKRLKLWSQSLELTGLDGGEAVRGGMDKFFVEPPLLDQTAPLPVRDLYFLDTPSGNDPSLRRVKGAENFSRMRAAFYRPLYCAALLPAAGIFAAATRLGSQLDLYVFDRPADRARFDANVDFLADAIRSGHG